MNIGLQIATVLAQSGFHPLHANQGNPALTILDAWLPKGVILDVALEEIAAFQIIDYIRKTPSVADTLIILVASVYNHSAYKRKPKSLYGADDYIEQHHIHDLLPIKLARIALPTTDAKTPTEACQPLRMKPQMRLETKQQIIALAHTIICDIALYYQDEIEAALLHNKPETLSAALLEGREMLSAQVDSKKMADWDPIQDAFNNLLKSLHKD